MDDREREAQVEARLGMVLRDRYRLDRVIGVGGMAAVYRATHRNQAEFAVKMLHPELSIQGDVRRRFLREGYVANSVKHPGAVLVVDDDVADDGSAYLVLELLRGASVEELFERQGRHVSSEIAAAIAHQVLEVLSAAHMKTIVHRDIKPPNLFVVRDGTVKVLDFGIAKVRDTLAPRGASRSSPRPCRARARTAACRDCRRHGCEAVPPRSRSSQPSMPEWWSPWHEARTGASSWCSFRRGSCSGWQPASS